jgi:hypothetical protein
VTHEVEPQHEDYSWFCPVNTLSLNDNNITLCEGDIVYFFWFIFTKIIVMFYFIDVHIPSHPLGDSDHNDDHVAINHNKSGRNNSSIEKCTIQEIENFTVCKKTKVRTKKHQVSTADLGVNCGTSPFRIAIKNQACSPLKWNVTDVKSLTNFTAKRKAVFTFDTISLDSSVDTDSSYDCTSDNSIVSHSDQSDLSSDFKHKSLLRCRELMLLYPRMYLGVDKEWISILSLISNKINVRKSSSLTPTDVIYLLFRKMRLNESFSILGHEFGISSQSVGTFFRLNLGFVADHFKELIVWPSIDNVKKNMPVSFRKNYAGVSCIIDCLEIEIEKPSNPVHQALTWSQYKKCNTLKYLMAVTPDGLISFVSIGFGGRATDEMVVSNSGFLDLLVPGTFVMADRGFKKIEPYVLQRQCRFVRPPSVSEGVALSKEQVVESRKIAGLRIHVERAISRIREFSFLAPHVRLDSNMIKYCDSVMYCVCGLLNVRGPLIK